MSIQAIFFDLGDTLVSNANTKTWLPGAKALIASLKAKGFRLGIISGTGNLTPRQAILNILPHDLDLADFESGLLLFTSEVGIEKPKKELFEAAVVATGIPAEQCLYCSENVVETLMAQHVGMRSIRVQTAPHSDLANLEADITKYHSYI
jgi:FMN phosphatase YigB (HAD superfamily)